MLGVTSNALARSHGYPLRAVVFAAVITRTVDAQTYYSVRSPYRGRPDCIYRFDRQTGIFMHDRDSALHSAEAHLERDVGRYPYYLNARVLISTNFRYCGPGALKIPQQSPYLSALSVSLGQAIE